LEEFNDVHELADGMSELPESGTSLREVAWLRKEVADMRERLLIRQRRMENSNPAQESWSTVQTTAALGATLVLGVLLLRARFNQESILSRIGLNEGIGEMTWNARALTCRSFLHEIDVLAEELTKLTP
jgi:hypothetical protein